MNSRLIELIQNPLLLQSEDLDLLQSEIQKKPYVQSLRALYLLGTYQFQSEKYPETLSETAAFTTDKKILYQFINGKIDQAIVEENNFHQEEEIDNKIEVEIPIINDENIIEEFAEEQPIETIIIENVEEEQPETLVEEKVETPSEIPVSGGILEEKTLKNEEFLEEESGNEINFHQSTNFLPEVQFSIGEKQEEKTPEKPSSPNKHELEMQRLIEEVERKMKAKKTTLPPSEKVNQPEENSALSSEISFAETQNFEVKATENQEQEIPSTMVPKVEKPMSKKQPESHEAKSTWKPMTVQGSTPDSLIKKEESSTVKQELKSVEKDTSKAEKTNPKDENDFPIMNVSFFSDKIETIRDENAKGSATESTQPQEESNIPKFINTWQNWLKIDRVEEVAPPIKQELIKEDKENKKTVAIEKFIENEPKISQLKEENSYVVKEKKNDISHLMTETLANIYVEQKLYSKAIKAFNTLITKHPEKEDYFKEKIKEINESKG